MHQLQSNSACFKLFIRTWADRFSGPLRKGNGRQAESAGRLYLYLSAALFLVVTAFVILTFRQYGMSWDEPSQHDYGEKVFRYYSSFFRDRSSIYAGDLVNYGGFFELLAFLSTRILPFGIYETRHLITALFGIGGILASWKTVRLLVDSRAAFWTALLLALCPSYYGHMFINSKDIPFAVLYSWALYYLVQTAREFPMISAGTAIRSGVAIGLTMAVRIGGLILLCYLYCLFAALSVHLVWCRLQDSERLSTAKVGRGALMRLAITTIVAYCVMLVFWPYAAHSPFKHPFAAWAWLSHVKPAASPIDYVPRYLLVKLPELIIALIVIGSVVGIRGLVRTKRRSNFPRMFSFLLLIFSILIPVAYTAITRPFLYDEIRHFLFLIPPLICLASITLAQVVAGRLRMMMLVTLAIYLSFLSGIMKQLHPYEYSYFNVFIGGVYGAHLKHYETEYWATSYKEGVEKLEAYLRCRDGPHFEKRQYNIIVGPAAWCATYYFPANFRIAREAGEADFYLSTTRDREDTRIAGRHILTVSRFDVPYIIGKIPTQGKSDSPGNRAF